MRFMSEVIVTDRKRVTSTLFMALVVESVVILLLVLVLFSSPKLATKTSSVTIDLTMDCYCLPRLVNCWTSCCYSFSLCVLLLFQLVFDFWRNNFGFDFDNSTLI